MSVLKVQITRSNFIENGCFGGLVDFLQFSRTFCPPFVNRFASRFLLFHPNDRVVMIWILQQYLFLK